MRLAASRTFCTAGRSSPIRTAMMAMTTSSSISVKPGRRERCRMRDPPKADGAGFRHHDGTPPACQVGQTDWTRRSAGAGSSEHSSPDPLVWTKAVQTKGSGLLCLQPPEQLLEVRPAFQRVEGIVRTYQLHVRESQPDSLVKQLHR